MDINSKIKIIYKYLAIILMFGLSNFLTTAHAENYTIKKIINGIDANVIFMRHALAPGIGDPNKFKIGDCSTQRNLNETGIAQAVLIGKQLKENLFDLTKYIQVNGVDVIKLQPYLIWVKCMNLQV